MTTGDLETKCTGQLTIESHTRNEVARNTNDINKSHSIQSNIEQMTREHSRPVKVLRGPATMHQIEALYT